MVKFVLPKSLRSFEISLRRHSPEILTGIGVAGFITSTILAVKATPKAIILLDEEKKKKKVEKLPPVEVVKTTWKCYVPAAATGILAGSCVIGGQVKSLKHNAALAAAYSLSRSTLKTYQDKVIETIGEKKEREIRDEIAKDQIRNAPVGRNEIIVAGDGKIRCYDPITNRYFYSTVDHLRKTEIKLNKDLINCMFVSLSDYYYEVGLSPTNVSDDLGWNSDDDIEFDFSSQLDESDNPCLVVSFHVGPRTDYRVLH